MKANLRQHIKRMSRHDKLYGTTTVGARGQVVIPAQARKDMNLSPGDQLIVMGKYGKALGFIKADQLQEIVDVMMKGLANTGLEKDIKGYMNKLFGKSFARNDN